MRNILLITSLLLGLGFLPLMLFWAPDRTVDELKTRWASAPSQFVHIDGISIHVRDEGPRNDQTPIVLIHGTSASLHTWDGWVEALKGQRRIIRFDLPGFGLSGQLPHHAYTFENYVLILKQLLQQLGVENAILGGNSLGGAIAWLAAVRFPEKVEKLILVDAIGYPIKKENMPDAWHLIKLPYLHKVLGVVLPKFMVEKGLKDLYGDPGQVTPELVERYYQLALREGNRQALRERLLRADEEDISHLVKEISVPTLIIWGAKDPLVPVENAARFSREIPRNELVTLEGLGHVPHEEAPETTVEFVKAFLQ
jgi:pimeloyl-ACP methyl ester carboxylesterase